MPQEGREGKSRRRKSKGGNRSKSRRRRTVAKEVDLAKKDVFDYAQAFQEKSALSEITSAQLKDAKNALYQAAKTAVKARRVDPSKSSEAAKKLNSKAKEIKDVADGLYKNAKANKKAAQKLAKSLKKHSAEIDGGVLGTSNADVDPVEASQEAAEISKTAAAIAEQTAKITADPDDETVTDGPELAREHFRKAKGEAQRSIKRAKAGAENYLTLLEKSINNLKINGEKSLKQLAKATKDRSDGSCLTKVKEGFNELADQVEDALEDAEEEARKLLGEAKEKLEDVKEAGLDVISDITSNAAEAVGAETTDGGTLSACKEKINACKAEVEEKLEDVQEAIESVAEKAAEAVDELGDIFEESADKVAEAGEQALAAVENQIQTDGGAWSSLQASCTKCTKETREAIDELAQDAQELVKDIESEVKDALNLDDDEAQEEAE